MLTPECNSEHSYYGCYKLKLLFLFTVTLGFAFQDSLMSIYSEAFNKFLCNEFLAQETIFV